ncbi:bifunctional (p)ppGpp synthetase/guanosine-3',5'-bis(diphosphate) 3'-pyrophosphohydrolase [Patescibacteria group bacterium]|nr:bifunctional (p)ppGpp synthetase/guanosine-3',5'-bis(diphosphate) 3'-pyrophosphohydrolase [Patescibacteria group bacterium]
MMELKNKIKKELGESEIINSAFSILSKETSESDFLFSHSLRTALILKKMGSDEETIVAGMLHHVPKSSLSLVKAPEETKYEILRMIRKNKQLRTIFSSKKTSKPKSIKKWQKIFLDVQAENLRRMIFVITKDLRPIFVMLAGRLDEMRNLQNFPKEYQQKEYQRRKSVEALEILAPLAYGIGMWEVKGELEDLAFPYLYQKEYKWLLQKVKEKYSEREKHLERVKPHLLKMLTGKGITILDIYARAKHYFSLYQKLLRHNMDIEKIYDLVALSIVVPDIESCYRALGTIHNTWPPLLGRIKDYISSPKPNGYRALHTTVRSQGNKIIEIQIKTPEMHKEARYGAAAHLSYKEKVSKRTYKHQFYWLDQLRKWKEELKDTKKISEHLKSEMFRDRVFVFTPKGDVIDLPRGATSVDFAYAVHSEIGDHTEAAKINGKIVPLNQVLENGQTVEISTDKNKTPSSDWLRFIKTPKARSKIKSFLEAAYGISPEKPRRTILREKVSIIKKILPIKRKRKPQVLVAGESGISIKLSKCCKPEAGDQISAFITKGEGASLHKIDCQNLKELKEKWPQKIVKATWSSEESKKLK